MRSTALQADLKPDDSICLEMRLASLNSGKIQSNAEIIADDLFRSDETIRAGVHAKAGGHA